MSKRVSNNQRIINFGLEASEGELNFAIESLSTIRASRFPKVVAKAKKPRSDKGTTRMPKEVITDGQTNLTN